MEFNHVVAILLNIIVVNYAKMAYVAEDCYTIDIIS